MGVPVINIINEAKRYLYSGHREPINLINNAVDASQTTIELLYPLATLRAGAYISVDLEIMHVWSISEAAKTAVVQRAMLGSSSSTHASQSLVTVNPKFPDFNIHQAIKMCMFDLIGYGLFATQTETFIYDSAQMQYPLTPDNDAILAGLDCLYDYPGSSKSWPRINNFEIRRGLVSDDFDGYALKLYEPAFNGRDVHITYSREFAPLGGYTATQADIPDAYQDVLALGAALRLQGVREGQRNFNEAQPETRRSAEVAAGAQIAATRGLSDFYTNRIRQERSTLRRKYPFRRKVL